MERSVCIKAAFVVLALSIVIGGAAKVQAATENIGSVVALKGSATIQRDAKALEAKVKDGILLKDTVETKASSKTKMLFIDDSVLTMGEKARVVIKDFVYSKDKGGKSIFNLIDGKMRSVVGKSEFEVHTPTAVAAARGTVIDFETGMLNGVPFTIITCLEGTVEIRNIDPTIAGRVSLRQGMTMTIMSGQPLPSPTFQSSGSTQRGPAGFGSDTGPTGPQIIKPVIINQEPPKIKTPINIGIRFP